MPLGTREVLLIIRARDQATRVLADVGRSFTNLDAEAQKAALSGIKTGSALAGVGIGLTTIGLVGLNFFKDATKAAVDYNQQAALTLTQVDQTGVKLEDVKRIGRDVAAAIPAPFDQMQKSLYDIFSSMDVNTQQAQTLLEAFSKGAVAGQVDVQQAGRATIAIMNAFKVPVSDVNKVMDVQFETVKKGVITYDEFSKTVGRAIPSAERAGQSYAQLGAMIAFMTRNGLSAAQASTSAARALDMLSNPKFAENMSKFGISVYDAQGHVRPMVDVIDDLRGKLQGLTPEQATAKLAELGKGAGGTIQAMRFLNLAVNDTQGQFDALTSDITNSSGSMQNAYDIMFKQPQSQSQLFKNNLDILKTEIGDALLPALNKLLEKGTALLKWFNDMDPSTRKVITIVAVLGFGFITLAGIVVTLTGAVIILNGVLILTTGSSLPVWLEHCVAQGLGIAGLAVAVWSLSNAFKDLQANDPVSTVRDLAFAFGGLFVALTNLSVLAPVVEAVAGALGVSFGVAAAVIAVVVIAVLLLAYVIYRNWGTIRDVTEEAWGKVWDVMQWVWDHMQQFWDWISKTAENVWGHMVDVVEGAWNGIVDAFDKARDAIAHAWHDILGWVQNVWNKLDEFGHWVADTFGPGFMKVVHAIGGFFSDVGAQIWETIVSLWSRLMWSWSGFMTIFVPVFWWARDRIKEVWDFIYDIIRNDIDTIVDIFKNVLGPAVDFVKDIFNTMKDSVKNSWDQVWNVISLAIDIIKIVIETGVDIIKAIWDNFGATILDTAKNIWNFITDVIATAITLVKDIINFVLNLIQGDWGAAWNSIKQFFSDAWHGVWNILQDVWHLIVDFFKSFGPNVLSFIGDLGRILWQKGWDLLNGLWEGAQSIWGDLVGWVMELGPATISIIGDLGKVLWNAGAALIQGLWDGAKSVWNDFTGWLGNLNPASYFNDINYEQGHAYYNMQPAGQALIEGLQAATEAEWQNYAKYLQSLDPSVALNVGVTKPSGLGLGGGTTVYVQPGAIVVNGVTDPAEVAAQVHAQFNEVVNERIAQGVS